MTRCAIYCRVSLEEQKEQFGLASQLRILRERANGCEVIEYIDDGYSGEYIERPALDKLRAAIRAKTVDLVLAHDPDRLSRIVFHLGILRDEIDRHGVRLEFVTMPLEATAESKMFFQMKGVFAEYEREKIRERTLRGRKEKARQGYIVGGKTTYGYDYLGKKDGGRGTLVPNAGQAEVVRDIFARALAGESTRSIVVHLNESGIRPHSASRWGKSTVARILRNEMYIGQGFYNRRQKISPPNPDTQRRVRKTRHRWREAQEWIPVPVPPIVAPTVFYGVAERLRVNLERMVGRPSRSYLLRGLMTCKACGRKWSGNPMHGVRYYRCTGRDRHRVPRCLMGTVKADRIETAVWQAVTGCFLNPETLRVAVERNAEKLFSGVDCAAELKRLKRLVEGCERKEFRAARALLDSELADHYEMFRAELRAAKAARREAEQEIVALQSVASPLNAESICEGIRDGLLEITETERREFLGALVEGIVFDGKEAVINCVLPAAASNCPQRQHVVGNTQPLRFSLDITLVAA